MSRPRPKCDRGGAGGGRGCNRRCRARGRDRGDRAGSDPSARGCDYWRSTPTTPDAPDDAKSEAITRLAGYTFGSAASSFGAVRRIKAGDVETEFAPMHAASLRSSGAASVLTYYRVRRSGIIGGD